MFNIVLHIVFTKRYLYCIILWNSILGVVSDMFWKIFVEIICAFIPNINNSRYKVKMYLRHIWALLHVKRRAAYVGKGLKLGGNAYVTKQTIIHENVHLGNIRVLGPSKFEIGSYCAVGEDLLVLTGNHNYLGNMIPFDDTWIDKDVVVEDACWIGARVTLLPGTHIGEGAIIQGGAVVHGNIPPLAIAGGNPAKVFKYRDKEVYEKLKAENRYYIS